MTHHVEVHVSAPTRDEAVERHASLERSARAFAEGAALAGHHVSVQIFEPYDVADYQPDPIVRVWVKAVPASVDPECLWALAEAMVE